MHVTVLKDLAAKHQKLFIYMLCMGKQEDALAFRRCWAGRDVEK